MKLIVVRHGESVWNRQGLIQGQLDSPLTALGQRQIAALRVALAGEKIKQIYSSPASRAQESARLLVQPFQCPVTTDGRLHERHYGLLQGKSYQTLQEQYHEQIQPLLNGCPQATIPEGESVTDVGMRLLSFIDERAEQYAKETVIVVTHGDVLAILIWILKGRQMNDDLRRYHHLNASFTQLEITENHITLLNWGVGTHLLNVM